MTLPTEVVDHILGFLQLDLITLEICAQSHPILSKVAERYLYASLTLYDDLELFESFRSCYGLRTSEFVNLLADNPEIVNHVRNLVVIILDKPNAKDQSAMVSHLDSMTSILPLFSGLTRIAIEGNTGGLHPCVWDRLPESFRQACPHIFHIPSMKDIYICNMASFPLSLLNSCRNVRVDLHSCIRVQYDKGSEEASCPPFEHLSVRFSCSTSLKNIMTWIQEHNLRSLLLRGVPLHDFGRLLPQSIGSGFNSLRKLELQITTKFGTRYIITEKSSMVDLTDTIQFPFSLANLPHLEQLTISAFPRILENWIESPAPAIMGLIQSAPPTLKQLFLEFGFFLWSAAQSDVIWFPFIPLAAECASLSITAYMSPTITMSTGQGQMQSLSPSDILSSMASCVELKPYVEKGVMVLEVE